MGRPRSPVPRSRVPLHRRLRVDPRPVKRWAVVVLLAGLTAGLVGSLVTRAEATRERWGRSVPVLVTTGSLARGAELSESITTVDWPVALVPAGALDRVEPDARTATAVGIGMPLTDEMVAEGKAGEQELHAVAVPWGRATLPLAPGASVDIWATVDPSLSGRGLSTRRVATGSTVLAVEEHAVTVGLDREEVAAVAEALALATITLVQVP